MSLRHDHIDRYRDYQHGDYQHGDYQHGDHSESPRHVVWSFTVIALLLPQAAFGMVTPIVTRMHSGALRCSNTRGRSVCSALPGDDDDRVNHHYHHFN